MAVASVSKQVEAVPDAVVEWDLRPTVEAIKKGAEGSIGIISEAVKGPIKTGAAAVCPSLPQVALNAVADVGCAKATAGAKSGIGASIEKLYADPEGSVARVTRRVLGK